MEFLLFLLAGLFLIFNTIVKPRYFWEHRKAQAARLAFGDKVTTIMYLSFGGLIATVGIIGLIMTALNIDTLFGLPLR